MTQRVLVLGAGGFIGRRLVAALEGAPWAAPIAAGHRSPPGARAAETVRLDAADGAALARVVARADSVVNCITGGADTIVATARALFSAAGGAARAPRVVHLSTMAVYGAVTGIVDETAELRGELGAYATAKVEAERIAASFGGAVVLRPGCVYGPGSVQWSERIARWLTTHRVGDLGAVPVRRISRRRLTLETKLWAPPLKVAELAARRARLHRIRIPPPIPPALLRTWGQEIRLDVRKAQQVLGLSWTPVESGLRETAALLRTASAA